MSAQKGKDLLLKVDSDGAGTFTTVAGMRSRSLAFNTETVDITHAESAGRWRELLAGAGAKHARVTGAGIFKDAASDALIRDYVFNGTIRDWQIVIPDFGTVEGPFQIASLRTHRPPRRRNRLRAVTGLRRRTHLRCGLTPSPRSRGEGRGEGWLHAPTLLKRALLGFTPARCGL